MIWINANWVYLIFSTMVWLFEQIYMYIYILIWICVVGEFRGVDDDYNLCLMRWPNLEVARASSLRLCSVDALIWSNDLQERSRKKARHQRSRRGRTRWRTHCVRLGLWDDDSSSLCILMYGQVFGVQLWSNKLGRLVRIEFWVRFHNKCNDCIVL